MIEILEEKIYKWILINKETYKYYDKHIATEIPECGQPDLIEWKLWNKPLPDDIDTVQYKYENGELVIS